MPNSTRAIAFLAAALAVLWAAPLVVAHGLDASLVAIDVLPEQAMVSVQVNVSDIFTHFEVDADANQRITPAEIDAALPRVYDFLESAVILTADGTRLRLRRPDGPLTRRITSAGAVPLLAHELSAVLPLAPESLTLSFAPEYFGLFGEQHRALVRVTAGARSFEGACSREAPSQTFQIREPTPLAVQLKRFIVLGIEHIFLGYDHLMFLLALILLGGRFLDLVKIVTAFTVAHSITLILAALQIITLPSRLIESGIALSIAYVAAENLFRDTARHRWVLTFCFGLVHGFGFANVLRELGLPSQGLVLSLLGFNLGVEIGQVCVVAVLFPAVLWLGRRPAPLRRRVVTVVSAGILLFGMGWFVERAFGLKFMPF